MRCRPDGTGIEVFSTGTRNHLEPNLDARDNLFTYDNTDDGDGWWTRVTHHIDGGYYGYPYDYHDHKDRMLDRMAEYGGGSPCGGVLYKEDAWPEKYRGLGLWAEWGKSHVAAIRFEPSGASFKVAEYIKLRREARRARSSARSTWPSRYDGKTLYIADWGMGGWGTKTEKVGRVYAVTYEGKVETRPRGQGFGPDRGADQGSFAPVVQRADAGAGGVDQEREEGAGRNRADADRRIRGAGRREAPRLGLRGHTAGPEGGAPRADPRPRRQPVGRRARAGGSGDGDELHGEGRRRSDETASPEGANRRRPRRPAPGNHRAGSDRRPDRDARPAVDSR